jgi:superfamily II DNA or RNA helicase
MNYGLDPAMTIPEELSYLQEEQILICLLCHVGVGPGNAAETHFRNVHQWKGEQLMKALAYISTLPLRDPHTTELPPNGSAVIPELGKPVNGCCCVSCGSLTSSEKHIKTHLRKTGHWGGEGESWKRVVLQTFSRGRHARYWIVKQDGGEDGDAGSAAEGAHEEGEAEFQTMLERYQAKYDAKRTKRREVADNPTGVENQSTWVREMGWAEHFDKKQIRQIYLASLMPRSANIRVPAHRRNDETMGEVDMVLRRLGGSFDRIMRRCAARLKLVPHETLRWLNSIDPMKPAARPFTLKENEKSMYRYRQFMKRCLVYCSRAGRLGRNGARLQHRIEWTDEQWALLEQVNAELTRLGPVKEDIPAEACAELEAELEAELDQVVFRYCISMLRQQVAFKPYVNPLLHFAAVLGINDATGGWAEPKHYTASLAGLVWCSRMLMLEDVFQDSPDDPNDVTVDMVEHFKAQQRQWLADGTHSPFSTMIRWMTYGKGFRKKEGGMAKVLWEDNGEALRYMGQRIKVVDFVDAANAVVTDLEAMLDQFVFGPWKEVSSRIDLSRIVDSLIYGGPDSSFATDPRNGWLEPGFAFLAARARASMWRRDGGWKPKNVRAQLRLLKRIKRLLMAAIHIWAGQPGRGMEMATIKHCGTQQVPGNIFIFDGQVMVITDRDKSRAIRGLGRKVARFLPERVGKMVVAYIIWLIPFEELLHDEAGIPGPDETLSSYMFKDARQGAYGTEQLSEALASLMGEEVGVELMVSDYRHVAIGLGRWIKGIIIRRVEAEMGEGEEDADGVTGEAREGSRWEYIWDAQATHGSAIAAVHYAVDMRFPNQLQPEKIEHFREISRLWHRFLERGGSQSSSEAKEPKQEPSRKRKRVSERDERYSAETEGFKSKRIKLSQPVHVQDMQRGLEQLVGPQAVWKIPEQGQAMEAIMDLTKGQTLIVVLPTGAGKSILFMLPTLLDDAGTNIVVVPFSALMDDLVDRARQAGIDCIRWKPARLEGREQSVRAARMVVVSADVEEIEQFRNYMDSLRSRKLLRRIFFDEGHTAILDVSFRCQLEDLKGLHRYGCPVITLTATLPGVMERWFRQTMLMGDAAIVRASTVKRNIRYNVIRVTSGVESEGNGRRGKKGVNPAVQDEVVRVVLRMEKTMQGDQKGVVYCRSRTACQDLADKLGCEFYHSGITDEGERREKLKKWVNGTGGNRWITATTGLGTGVDIRGIVGVVHMEQPYGIVDFVQQTGRGGRREGEIVESVVVMDEKKVWMDEKRSDMEHLNHQAMEWFVESQVCRRVPLGMFMDGGLEGCGQDCEQLQVEMCDRCREKHGGRGEEGEELVDEEEEEEASEDSEEDEDGEDDRSSDVEPASNRFNEYVKEKHARIGELRGWLDKVGDRCPVCVAMWRSRGGTAAWRRAVEHQIEDCKLFDHKEYSRWRERVDFADYRCCWPCGLPQSFCDGGERKQACEWGDKMMPLVWWVTRHEGWRAMVQQVLGFEITPGNGNRERAYIRWVSRSRRMYDEDMTNAIAVWDMVVRETERVKQEWPR